MAKHWKNKKHNLPFPDLIRIIDQHIELLNWNYEITEAQWESLWKQICDCDAKALEQACEWYVYHQEKKFPSNFLMDIRRLTKRFYRPPARIVEDGKEKFLLTVKDGEPVYRSMEDYQRKRRLHDVNYGKRAEADGRHKRVSAKPGSNLKALAGPVTKPAEPSEPPPRELEEAAQRQREALKKLESKTTLEVEGGGE